MSSARRALAKTGYPPRRLREADGSALMVLTVILVIAMTWLVAGLGSSLRRLDGPALAGRSSPMEGQYQ